MMAPGRAWRPSPRRCRRCRRPCGCRGSTGSPALPRLLDVGEDLGDQARSRLEDLGAHRPQGAQDLPVLHQLGLAPEALLDVASARRGAGPPNRSATSASWWLSSSHRTDVDLVDLGEHAGPAAGVGHGAGGPSRRRRRCPARPRWPRGAGRRRRGAPRRPAASAGARPRDLEPVAELGRGRPSSPRRPRGCRSIGSWTSPSSSWRWRVRVVRNVDAQLAVIRYSQVVNCASPR